MKVLFITSAAGVDYLADCVFHGLVDSGLDVVDSKYLWYLSQPLSNDQKSALYGKGFTIAGNLPDRSDIDRNNIKERILSKEFDLIVYGSIWRCSDYIIDVIKTYPKNRIIICDGEDHVFLQQNLLEHSLYFKRELISNAAFPISFAIPEEKITKQLSFEKKRKTAFIYPGRLETYIYNNEQDYYRGYQESMFGVTFKKAGWDCMRHYEIIMNACLPFFPGIENCPAQTMVNWPKTLQMDINHMYIREDMSSYAKILNIFFQYCKDNFTTKKLVDYILSKCMI